MKHCRKITSDMEMSSKSLVMFLYNVIGYRQITSELPTQFHWISRFILLTDETPALNCHLSLIYYFNFHLHLNTRLRNSLTSPKIIRAYLGAKFL